MQRKEKPYYDEQGSLIIRPYRMKDLAAIYGVSAKTIRRWLDSKVPDEGRKTNLYFTVDQVKTIVTALGIPHKISLVIPMQHLKQAV